MQRTVLVLLLVIAAVSCSNTTPTEEVPASWFEGLYGWFLLSDEDTSINKAARAYSSELDATAVAADVTSTVHGNLCLLWYVGGRELGDGLVIGDTVAGTDGLLPRTAELLEELRQTDEGKAVIEAVGCRAEAFASRN
jgi:hypothetical protein